MIIRTIQMVIFFTDSLQHFSSLSSSSPAHTPKEEYIIAKSEDSGELVGNHTEQPQSLGCFSYLTLLSILFYFSYVLLYLFPLKRM